MVDLELLDVFEDCPGQALRLSSEYARWPIVPGRAPGRDSFDLRVVQWLAGIDAEVNAACQSIKRVSVRCAMVIELCTGCK
ncbi:hypothetical protein JOF28_001632 [Leucobacter exalbidus]|uniref:Uncharacterized protein n=1 Tax=Leucobacter exalbidus TaxID=662960 RepID=A0A940T110_9MICO|nr:hypothetical protein [Leucobacter exalbidus]